MKPSTQLKKKIIKKSFILIEKLLKTKILNIGNELKVK